MTNDQLNEITDFFRPNRQIWQNAEEPGSSNIDTDAESDAGSNADTDSDTDFFDTESVPDEKVVRRTPDSSGEEVINTEKFEEDFSEDFSIDRGIKAIEFQKQAQGACNETVKEGGSAVECSLGKMKELQEVARFQKFIDELYEKFLVKGEGYEDKKNTLQRLQILKDECDMERIIKYFKESKSYRINTYTNSQVAENPDLIDYIIFTYKNGTTEIINLELTEEERSDIASPVIREVKGAKAEADKEAARANRSAAEQRWRDSHPMHDPWKEWRAKYEDAAGNKPSEEKQQPSEQQTSELYSDEYYNAFKIEEEQSRQE